jgi:hypothetical protein
MSGAKSQSSNVVSNLPSANESRNAVSPPLRKRRLGRPSKLLVRGPNVEQVYVRCTILAAQGKRGSSKLAGRTWPLKTWIRRWPITILVTQP